MSKMDQAIAANRFGLGARPGELDLGGDARQRLVEQVSDPHAFVLDDPSLPTGAQAVKALAVYREDRRERRQARQGAEASPEPRAAPMAGEAPMSDDVAAIIRPLRQLNQLSQADMQARMGRALTTETGFAERLVWFWANHFTVAASKAATIPFPGPFEREAIRPHLAGSFEDLLVAGVRHPGMLLYLDQAQSVGPNSLAGRRRDAGLNENLAREILELHTLGVHGGYGQADVAEFAKALTGWTFAVERTRRFVRGAVEGEFMFLALAHEPGARTVLGKTYPEGGEGQARAILADLARHPATARHVATKLARHFTADEPPPAVVARLEKTFLKTGGDLPSLHRALVESPEAWAPQPAKFKTPHEFIVSALRLNGVESLPGRQVQLATNLLGQPIFRAPSPAGWPDAAASWAGPDALMKRLEWTQALAGRLQVKTPPDRLAAQGLGPQLTQACITAVRRAQSPAQGLVLALMSPDFQRR